MKKGFTMLELMVSIAIIVLLTEVGSLAICKSHEKNSMNKMKEMVPTYLTNQMNRAYERGEKYEVIYNSDKHKIETYFNNTLISELILSTSLHYNVIPSSTTINNMGAYNNNFSFIISDKKNHPIFDVEIETTEKKDFSRVYVKKIK